MWKVDNSSCHVVERECKLSVYTCNTEQESLSGFVTDLIKRDKILTGLAVNWLYLSEDTVLYSYC